MKTIKVLLLEDMSDDFSKIKEIIEEISDEFTTYQIKLELLNDYENSLKLISNFVAFETMETYLQEPFKAVVGEMVQQIKKEDNLICILDIVWTIDAKKKIERGKTDKDEYGCTFYCTHLNNNGMHKNTIIVSALTKNPSKMRNMPLVPKLNNKIPFGDGFKAKLKAAICGLSIVDITEIEQKPLT